MSAATEMKFLIVDDFSTMRRIIRNLLKEIGYVNADEAEDGQVALTKLKHGGFDFVVSDINMPNMNGIEFTRQVRTLPAYRTVPIILLTTESDPEKKNQGRAAGATGWIVKPFKPDQLLAVVAKVLPN